MGVGDPLWWVLLAGCIIGIYASVNILSEQMRGAVFTFGKFSAIKGPGVVFIIPIVQILERISLAPFKASDVAEDGTVSFDGLRWRVECKGGYNKGHDLVVTEILGESMTLKVETLKVK